MIPFETTSKEPACRGEVMALYPFEGLRVLVVDDLVGTREVLIDMLAELGVSQVEQASSGSEAIARLSGFSADVVISDYVMSSGNGLEFREEMARSPLLREIPFILMSARRDLPTLSRSVGVRDHFLFKPLSFEALKKKLGEVCWSKQGHNTAQDTSCFSS